MNVISTASFLLDLTLLIYLGPTMLLVLAYYNILLPLLPLPVLHITKHFYRYQLTIYACNYHPLPIFIHFFYYWSLPLLLVFLFPHPPSSVDNVICLTMTSSLTSSLEYLIKPFTYKVLGVTKLFGSIVYK
jgi:hypothetical protein